MSRHPAAHQAVIDIGSNSVRLVVYGGPKRAPISIFNEKVLCGLGKREHGTGDLPQVAMEQALSVLGRFLAVLEEMGNPPVDVIATAAIREAPNGAEFARQIEALSFKPRILTGAEEARLAALGVLSGAPNIIGSADGARSHLCGDMGGGSLELVRYTEEFDTPIGNSVSLPLGPLRLLAEFGANVSDAVKPVKNILEVCDWLVSEKTEELHAVGGAWRALARIDQAKKSYPYAALHHFEMPRADILDICGLVEIQSQESLANIPGVQRKRIETLPHAAMVLRQVVELTKAKRVIISSFGVREGVLYDQLTPEEKRLDPLLEIAREYARRFCPNPLFGSDSFKLLSSLFISETPEERRLREAACLLGDISALFHPDSRADNSCDMLLRAPLVGIDHSSRVALALALYHRHKGRTTSLPDRIPLSLLTEEKQKWSLQIGLALRFASDLSPKSGKALNGCHFDNTGEGFIFVMPDGHEQLFSEVVMRRLMALSESFGKPLAIQRY